MITQNLGRSFARVRTRNALAIPIYTTLTPCRRTSPEGYYHGQLISSTCAYAVNPLIFKHNAERDPCNARRITGFARQFARPPPFSDSDPRPRGHLEDYNSTISPPRLHRTNPL